jgi:hypothetical protein
VVLDRGMQFYGYGLRLEDVVLILLHFSMESLYGSFVGST